MYLNTFHKNVIVLLNVVLTIHLYTIITENPILYGKG